MGWLKDFFRVGTSKLVDSVCDALDNYSSTDEDKLKIYAFDFLEIYY